MTVESPRSDCNAVPARANAFLYKDALTKKKKKKNLHQHVIYKTGAGYRRRARLHLTFMAQVQKRQRRAGILPHPLCRSGNRAVRPVSRATASIGLSETGGRSSPGCWPGCAPYPAVRADFNS